MKLPRDYIKKFSILETQFYITKIRTLLKKNLLEKFELVEWNTPLFNSFDLENESEIKRNITFDSVNTFSIYKLIEDNNYLAEEIIFKKMNSINSGFLTNFKYIDRDKKTENILELETEYIEIFLKDIKSKSDVNKILRNFYILFLNVYKSLTLLDPKFNLDFPDDIKKMNENKYKQSVLDIEYEQIIKEQLREAGVLYFFPTNNQTYQYKFLVLNKISKKIIEVASFEYLNPIITRSTSSKFDDSHSSLFKIKINFYNLLIFFLEKYNISELF